MSAKEDFKLLGKLWLGAIALVLLMSSVGHPDSTSLEPLGPPKLLEALTLFGVCSFAMAALIFIGAVIFVKGPSRALARGCLLASTGLIAWFAYFYCGYQLVRVAWRIYAEGVPAATFVQTSFPSIAGLFTCIGILIIKPVMDRWEAKSGAVTKAAETTSSI